MAWTKLDEVSTILNNYCVISENESFRKRIGMMPGIAGITTSVISDDVILYSRDFVDLFAALKALSLEDIAGFNRRFAISCRDLHDYIIKNNVFFPYFAIVTPDGILDEKPFFYDEEELRSLIVLIQDYLGEINTGLFDSEMDYRQVVQMLESCLYTIIHYLEFDKDGFKEVLEYISAHYYKKKVD